MKRVLIAVFLAVSASAIFASSAVAGDLYVTATKLNVRSCPHITCSVVNRIYRGQKVSVFARSGEWARISKYYPGPDWKPVARWVKASYLSRKEPQPTKHPPIPDSLKDPRIEGGMPKVSLPLTLEDVKLLRAYALLLVDKGICRKIVDADKSVNRKGFYYVACEGENSVRYFREEDVPYRYYSGEWLKR